MVDSTARVLLTAVAALLIAAPAAVAQQSELDKAVEVVSEDQFYLSPQLPFPPQAAQLIQREAQEKAPGKVWAAMLGGMPADVTAEEAVTELRDRVGKPGAYAVYVNDQFRTAGSQDAIDAGDAAYDAHRSDGPDFVMRDFIERAGQIDAGGGDGGGGGGAGAIVLLGAAAAGGVGLLAVRRRRRQQQEAQFAEVKTNARDDLVALGDDIRALDLDVQMPGLADETRDDYERAVNAYDRADTAWEQARRPEDLEPVGSALEEGRWAMECARARMDGREPPGAAAAVLLRPAPRPIHARRRVDAGGRRAARRAGLRGRRTARRARPDAGDPRGHGRRPLDALLRGRPDVLAVHGRLLRRRPAAGSADRLDVRLGRPRLRRAAAATSAAATSAVGTSAAAATSAAATSDVVVTADEPWLGEEAVGPARVLRLSS